MDLADPDCANGNYYETGFGNTECNDGIDNDGNLYYDVSDEGCVSALDEIENNNATTCANGSDDDDDGWIDADDVDCLSDDKRLVFQLWL